MKPEEHGQSLCRLVAADDRGREFALGDHDLV
jgi:hypothetical protein